MKNTFLFLGIIVLFSACNSIEQFKAPIEELSSNWESTTAAVTEFVGSLTGEEAKAQEMLQQIVAPEGANEAAMTQVAEIKNRFQAQIGQLGSLKETVMGFVAQWQEKSGELDALKEGLSSGNLGADTMEKVSGLQEMVSTATSSMDGWKSKFTEIQSGYTKVFEEYSAMKAAAMAQ